LTVPPQTNIHSDLTATCGIAAKPPLNRAPFTDCVELDTPVQDAIDASTALADTGLHPTDQTFTDITTDTTILATHDGLNVISVTGSISLTGKTLAFDANAFTSVAFVVNVQGGLTCSGCTVTVNPPLNFGDVLFNFPGSGPDASVKGPSSTFSGTLLGPQRNCTLDKGQLTGAMLCGGGILVHSAAQLCPGFDFVCPGP
jgi:choice-of-anchor A domain-containing protein